MASVYLPGISCSVFLTTLGDPQVPCGLWHWIWAGCCVQPPQRAGISSWLHISNSLPLLWSHLTYRPHTRVPPAKQTESLPLLVLQGNQRVTQHLCHQHRQENLWVFTERLWQTPHSPSQNGFELNRSQQQPRYCKYCWKDLPYGLGQMAKTSSMYIPSTDSSKKTNGPASPTAFRGIWVHLMVIMVLPASRVLCSEATSH